MPIPHAPPPPDRAPSRAPAAAAPPAPVRPREIFDPVAAVLAAIFPGAGHWYLGQRLRAGLLCAGVLSLFAGGILIGGIDVIDRNEDPIWFIGEALVGPLAFGIDHLHQTRFKATGPTRQLDGSMRDTLRTGYPGERRDDATGRWVPAPGAMPPNSKSLGRMNELGTLFATIAGMLNLIVIIDAGFRTRDDRLRKLGLRATLADTEMPPGAPQEIDASAHGARR
jgi:hypothetical protein